MPKIRKCYLCGKINPDTKDHTPPRGIFPHIPKGQLITVPCHERCNNKYSKADEVFRNWIIAASSRSKEGLQAWDEQVVTSWKKNIGAKRELQSRLIEFQVEDKSSENTTRGGIGLEVRIVD